MDQSVINEAYKTNNYKGELVYKQLGGHRLVMPGMLMMMGDICKEKVEEYEQEKAKN